MEGRISYLVSKKLAGDISEGEIRELNQLLSNQPELYQTILLIEAAWDQQAFEEADDKSVDRLLERVAKITDEQRFEDKANKAISIRKNKTAYQWVAAASVIIMVSLAIFWYSGPGKKAEERVVVAEMPVENEVETKPGSQTQIVLHDGTKVWLNADSRLSYANDFNGKTREVNLVGEAFFDVVSNKERPFIIHTSRIKVKVTGTSFNVRSYPDEPRVETSLIEGKVEVSLVNNPDKVFYLKPSQKLVINGLSNEKDKQEQLKRMSGAIKFSEPIPELTSISYYPEDSIPVETAWLNHQLVFFEESFREVANKMEKWYGVKIVFSTPALEKLKVTGRFETETLQEALDALKFVFKFRYDINKKTIVISRPKD